jgi:two-component system cell cycle response regulator
MTESASAKAESYTPASLRILLFEDNAMDAALIKKYLRTVGVPATQIYHADTIPSALQVLSREDIDLCLADYYLRPHTGFDLMDEARRFDVDVPFIVVTALDDKSVDDRALAHGAYDFLVKGDLTVEGLERSIRYTLAHHRRESKLSRAAFVDALTGIPNRAAFMERLTQTIAHNAASGGMVGVALFNLNGTKFINEAFGPNIGDDVLRCVGDRLKVAKRAGDVVARLGGDEFAVIMTDFLLANQALTTANTLAQSITGPVDTREGEHVITVAGGVAAYAAGRTTSPARATDAATDVAERLLQQACQAMFTAKHTARMNGRSHVAIAHMH